MSQQVSFAGSQFAGHPLSDHHQLDRADAQRSPSFSVARSTRSPLTKVPFVLSRSDDLELAGARGQAAVQPRHQRGIDDEVGARGAADGLHVAGKDAERERAVSRLQRS